MARGNGKNSIKRRRRILIPIGVKLVFAFTVILIIDLLIINNLNSGLVSQELAKKTEETNSVINSLFSVEAENRLNTVRKDVHLLLDFLRIAGKDSPAAAQAAAAFFERSYFIAAIRVPGYIELVNDQFFIANQVNPGTVSAWVSRENDRTEQARQGEPVFANPSLELGAPLLAIFYPWQNEDREEALIILLAPDGIAEIFGTAQNLSFLANADGDILFSTNFEMVKNSSNVSEHPLFTALSETGAMEISMVYSENGVKYIGAGKKLSPGNIMVFTSSVYDLVMEEGSAIFRRNIFLIISVVFASMIIIWLLSKFISIPLRAAVEAVFRLDEGNFEKEIKYRFHDEIGILVSKINGMGKSMKSKLPANTEQPKETHKKRRKK